MKKELSKYKVLIAFHVVIIVIIAGVFGMSKMSSTMEKYSKDWETVTVTADDISFEAAGFGYRNDRKVYKFVLNRKLHYSFQGKSYDVKDRINYENSDKNYSIELRNNYTDAYEYKVDPNNPKSFSKTYSSLTDDDLNLLGLICKMFLFLILAVLLIIDLVCVIKKLCGRRKVFDEK